MTAVNDAGRGQQGDLQHDTRDEAGRFSHIRDDITVAEPVVIPVARDCKREASTGTSVSYAIR
jgi:hypothetical protein